jgi:hypothetical protein
VVYAKLAPSAAVFIRTFSSSKGEIQEDFSATLDQTLFVKHNAAIRNLITKRTGSLLDRLEATKETKPLIDELFLSVFTRFPTQEEQSDIAELIPEGPNRSAMLTEIVWAMLTSTEFRFNH